MFDRSDLSTLIQLRLASANWPEEAITMCIKTNEPLLPVSILLYLISHLNSAGLNRFFPSPTFTSTVRKFADYCFINPILTFFIF